MSATSTARSIFPSGPIRKVTRFGYLADLSAAAPYAIAIDLSVSDRSGKGNCWSRANLEFADSSSNEMPRICAPAFWNWG
jgi:hypothetical protein